MQISSKRIAVIGLGNALRRDDGIGIVILESLLDTFAASKPHPEGCGKDAPLSINPERSRRFDFYKSKDIDYFNFSGAGLDLLHRLEAYDAVLLIDGINAGLNVGKLLISELKDIEHRINNSVTSTHELSLKDIFEFSKSLRIKTRIYVAGIQVGDTSFGEGLSQALSDLKADIIKEIVAFIDKTFLGNMDFIPISSS